MNRLIANRCSEISLIEDAPNQPLLVGTCRRGRSTSYTLVDRAKQRTLFDVLAPLVTRRQRGYAVCSPIFGPNRALESRRLPGELHGALHDMGLLIDRSEASRPVRFDCRLSMRPLRLLPRGRRTAFRRAGEWIAHPGLSVARNGGVPEACARVGAELPNGYASPSAWLQDPASSVMTPLWPSDKMRQVLEQLQPGHAASGMSPRAANVLKRMGVLILREELAQRRRIWERSVERGAKATREQGYWVIRRLFCDAEVAALRQYYRKLIEQGFLPYMDRTKTQRCFVTQNESIALFFQRQLTQLMERATGARLEPSFMSLAAYLGGAVLDKHVDGPTSDWNISLQLDFSPEPEGVTPWELCLQTTADETSHEAVYLGLGDAVIYRGNATPHFRPRLPDDMMSTALIYHWRQLS